MRIDNTNSFFFGENVKLLQQEEMKTVAEVFPEFQGKQVKLGKIDTETVKVDLSEEGLSSVEKIQYLRKAVQEMPDSGAVNFQELMELKEILPKVQMDPVYSHFEKIRDSRYGFLNTETEEDAVTNLQDVVTSWMKAYALQYDALVKAHADGSRDVYVQNYGETTESGNFVFHKVELAEDMEYMDAAFEKAGQAISMMAQVHENRWQVRNIFHGDEPLGIDLPENYGDKLQSIMRMAKDMFVEKYNVGTYKNINAMTNDISKMTITLLKEDTVFWKSMNRLFSKP
ncbi:MAG: hypothetical protein E7299_11660 [Lachnospiraceae bacterium]|nr:hypothetical protein [Lachnospiraceae bacterium]